MDWDFGQRRPPFDEAEHRKKIEKAEKEAIKELKRQQEEKAKKEGA
ncbi:hypothetical protein [Nocardiopsis composta]|uniref:Uncharacterized protein n=1 Tax=Nocardiopsis composta TaxID=157465 RepID=A0A7W8QJC6_9ACTN|nr:hypothetical protein [Nocardiopsis composta]MBB5431330.1 hypothetical protein [Nocardiopsis composta]